MATSKEDAKGQEEAFVTDMSSPEAIQRRINELIARRDAAVPEGVDPTLVGIRMEDEEHGKDPKPPKSLGDSGHWEEAQTADDPDAVYEHEQIWVEHHGMGNGDYQNGRLFKWVEDAK